MAIKDIVARKLIEITVGRAIKDIKEDPARGIRNLIENGQEIGISGKLQPEVLQTVNSILDDTDSPYYKLVDRTFKQVDQATLMDFGINIGQNSFSVGLKTIREAESKYRYNIPWIVGFTYGAGTALNTEKLGSTVADGKKLGIFTYGLMHTSGDVCSVVPLLTRHDDCAFVIFTTGEALTDAAIARLSRCRNLMVAVSIETQAFVSACRRLKDSHMLYSVYGYYGDDNIGDILSDKWLEMVTPAEPVFSFLSPSPGTDEDMRDQVADYVKKRRFEPKFSTIAVDIPSDALAIDGVVSEGDCSAMFDAEGQLYGYAHRYAGAEFNLLRSPLRGVLMLAFPKDKQKRS